jgi:hypothetical protein
MPRRLGWVLTLVSFLPVVSGWTFAVHHAQATGIPAGHSQCDHGHSDSSGSPQSKHDSEKCVVCHLLAQTGHVELQPGVSLPDSVHPSPAAPVVAGVFSPDPIPLTVAGPRAPPVL